MSASYSAFWCYDSSMGNYAKEFVSQDKVYSTYEAEQYASLVETIVQKAAFDSVLLTAARI